MSSNYPPGVSDFSVSYSTMTGQTVKLCRFCEQEIVMRCERPNICDDCAESALPDREDVQ